MKNKIYERIVSEINPDVENPQLSERTIRETLDVIVPEDISEEGVDAFIEKQIPLFKTMAGNVRKDVSDFVKKTKPKAKPEDVDDPNGKETPDTADDKGDEDDPLKVIMKELAEIKRKQEEQDNKRTVETSKAILEADALKLYPENVVRAASMDFNFSVDNAKEAFFNKLSEFAKLFNVKPEGGKPDAEFNSEDFLKRNRERFKHS